MLGDGVHYRTIWLEGRIVRMIDQTQLPFRFVIFDSASHTETARCISGMVVRGAGAIGAAGAALAGFFGAALRGCSLGGAKTKDRTRRIVATRSVCNGRTKRVVGVGIEGK